MSTIRKALFDTQANYLIGKIKTELENSGVDHFIGTRAQYEALSSPPSQGSVVIITDDFANDVDVYDAIRDTNGFTRKNLIPWPYADGSSKTANGVTFTVNCDGSVTISGTASAETSYVIKDYTYQLFEEGNYIASAIGSIADVTLRVVRAKEGSAAANYNVYSRPGHEEFTVNYSEFDYFLVQIRVKNGTNITTPITLYPMIRRAEVEDSTYEPPSETVDRKIEKSPNQRLELINLGTAYTAELKQDISSGTFKKAVVGGYLTINNHVYYFAHPDYWFRTGDTECTTHHMLVVPAIALVHGKMNSTNITTGAYIGSDFKTGNNSNTALADIKAIIQNDFGASNILTHREYFANAVQDGKSSAGAWYDSDIDLMNERMVYGCPVFEAGNIYTIDKSQLKLFAERPDLNTFRTDWWLRDVVSGTGFSSVGHRGTAGASGASTSLGIRPCFAVC